MALAEPQQDKRTLAATPLRFQPAAGAGRGGSDPVDR